MKRILVLDDKQTMREMVETVLSLEHEVRTFGDPRTGLDAFARESFDVVVTDIRMPEVDGIEVLKRVKSISPDAEVIVMTAFGTVSQAVEAMRLGAFDYLTKPFEPQEIAVAVEKALEHQTLRIKAERLEREAAYRRGLERLVGESPAIREVRLLVEKVAPSGTTVLVTGPSGTGKELVAQALHERSPRAARPFVVVHCAALPRELTESELFGHVKGAFSGATGTKRGLVDEAEGGTLFLDDVNYIEIGLQAKVNRLIQEKEVKPVGSTAWKKVDVRIVASANVDLEAAARRGEFREDLYYRLNVFSIRLPPLAERAADIPLLARHFLEKHGARLRKTGVTLSTEALAALSAARWPGNVRELENAIERALILVEGNEIAPAHLPQLAPRAEVPAAAPAAGVAVPLDTTYTAVIERVTADAGRAYVTGILARCGGNVSRAAEHAGMSRQHLYRLMKRFGLAETESPGPSARPDIRSA